MSSGTPQQPNYAELHEAYTFAVSEKCTLESEIESLKRQLAWFQKQMFGSKSERRLVDANPDQLALEGLLGDAIKPEPVEKETITYERGKAKKKRGSDCVTDSGLRFDDTVPVEEIEVEAKELKGPDADQYEIIEAQ